MNLKMLSSGVKVEVCDKGTLDKGLWPKMRVHEIGSILNQISK